MDCNKDEAIRAKELAEKKIAEKDAAGAKRFALKALDLYPELDGLPQFLATLDIYLSADKKINGEADWYSVLGVQPSADEDTIRKRYRKLVLILHPDKNKSVGADGAFKILQEAWVLLSDKEKRTAYDQKRNSVGSYTYVNVFNGKSSSSVPTSYNDFHYFSRNNISNTSNQNSATYSRAPPPQSARLVSFWTICNSCKMHFEYERKYVNCNLTCQNCRMPFFAFETPAPPLNRSRMYTPLTEFLQRQKFCQVHKTGPGRSSGLHTFTELSQKGAVRISERNINVGPAASFTARVPGVTHIASETLHKESQTSTMREESLSMRFHPSQNTKAGLSTGSSASSSSFPAKKHRPKKKRCMDERDMRNQMAIGNEEIGHPSFEKSGFEKGRTIIAGSSITNSMKESLQLEDPSILVELAKKEICKKLNSSSSASPPNACNKQKAFTKGVDEMDGEPDKDAPSMKHGANTSMEFGDIKSGIQPEKLYTVDADVDLATNEPGPMSMSVPDPDFHDFDEDRTENSFGENQVWAAYDDDDGMPRYYAMIHCVVSRKPFKMRMSWLNSKRNMELGSVNWIGSGFYKTSGEFWIGKHEDYRSLNSFSHKVRWSKGRKGAIQIYPREGDVWALYRNWSSDWNEHTPDEVIHKYAMVEVLEDFNEQNGVAVAPLVKVPGFKTVFQRNSKSSKPWMIPREELFRLSHQVPSRVLTGQEGHSAPRGCLELDPAAAPLELLQVLTEAQVREMEVITERLQEETGLGDLKRSKEKELLENDAVMEEDIKEVKENEKPGLLVYHRRQRRKLEC